MNEDEKRKDQEKDEQEDLELAEDDAETVAGGGISYSKVSVEYQPQKPDGSLGT